VKIGPVDTEIALLRVKKNKEKKKKLRKVKYIALPASLPSGLNYLTNFHHLIIQCRQISGAINACNQKVMVHSVSERESRVNTVNFDVCKKPPKLIAIYM